MPYICPDSFFPPFEESVLSTNKVANAEAFAEFATKKMNL